MKIRFLSILLCYTPLVLGQQTRSFADSIRVKHRIPELAYAVLDDKTTLEIAALGKHSVALADVASLTDRFHIGSNTKAMTSFIIAKYVEKGILKWTTPFFDVFPEWKKNSLPEYAAINLEELLSHRAGILPFQGENDPIIPDFKGSPAEKREQFGKFVLTLPPVKKEEHVPFVYSNAGYTLASLMLEKVTGKTWEELMQNVFNKDLHLNIKFSWPENQKNKDTWGHQTEEGILKPVPSTWDYHLDYTEPAGDVNISLVDYIKFIQLHLKGLKHKNNYLKATTYNHLLKGVKNYALGWYNLSEKQEELSVHSGTGAFTYFSIVHIDRKNGKAYIIFTNAFNDDTLEGVRLLMRKLKENNKLR